MRVGLIGAGRIGTLHAGVLKGIEAVDDLLVADALPDRAKHLATDVGAQYVEDPNK